MGTTVIGEVLAAALIAIFLIPVTYYVVERFVAPRKQREPYGDLRRTIETRSRRKPPSISLPLPQPSGEMIGP